MIEEFLAEKGNDYTNFHLLDEYISASETVRGSSPLFCLQTENSLILRTVKYHIRHIVHTFILFQFFGQNWLIRTKKEVCCYFSRNIL